RVLGDLAESGYDAEWDCLPAASVGASHIRDRVFILAYPRCESRLVRRCSVNGRNKLVQQGNYGRTSKRGENRKLIAMVPGIRSGASAHWWRAQSRVARSIDDFPER